MFLGGSDDEGTLYLTTRSRICSSWGCINALGGSTGVTESSHNLYKCDRIWRMDSKLRSLALALRSNACNSNSSLSVNRLRRLDRAKWREFKRNVVVGRCHRNF
jgi:hypothetical protein